MEKITCPLCHKCFSIDKSVIKKQIDTEEIPQMGNLVNANAFMTYIAECPYCGHALAEVPYR